MKESTIEIVRAALKTDESVTPAERQKLIALLRNGGKAAIQVENKTQNQSRIMRLKEVAERLGRSKRVVDRLCKEGLLKKVTLPGRKYGSGILASSFEKFLAALGEGANDLQSSIAEA